MAKRIQQFSLTKLENSNNNLMNNERMNIKNNLKNLIN